MGVGYYYYYWLFTTECHLRLLHPDPADEPRGVLPDPRLRFPEDRLVRGPRELVEAQALPPHSLGVIGHRGQVGVPTMPRRLDLGHVGRLDT